MSRYVLILIVGAFLTYGIINLTLNNNVTRATENATDDYSLTKARNIANSTAEIIFSSLGDNINWRVNSPETIEILDGEATYSVQDAFFNGDSLIKISIMGTYFNNLKSVTIYTARNLKSPGSFPPGVKGVFTSDNEVNASGKFIIDGRDHSSDGTLIPIKGTWGVWTTDKFVQQGAAGIGGTFYTLSGNDVSPSKNAVQYLPVVAQYQTYTGGYPTSPEQVFGGLSNGYPEDILKEIAKNGLFGSQYTTNAASLTYPLKGVTYVDLPSGGTFQNQSIAGSGLLIVHNNSLNAKLTNINSGTFTGLIIADDIIRIHANIIGAVVSLTPNPSEGNVIGNGNGSLLYSKETVIAATEFATTHNFGFRGKRVAVKYWFE